jgi:hypothetical protein
MIKMFGLKKDYVGVILEKPIIDRPVKNFPTPYGTPKLITVLSGAHYRNQLNPETIPILQC